MPAIPQYYRQQRLSRTAGNIITDVSTDNRQLAQLGNVLTEIGMRSEQERLQAQYHDQLNNAKLQVAKMFDEYNDSLDINDTSGYLDNLEKVHAKYDSIKFTNADAQSEFGQLLESIKYNQKKIISDKIRTVDAKLFTDRFNNNVNVSKNLAAKADTEGEFNLIAHDTLNSLYGVEYKDGGLQLIEGWKNPLFNSDEERITAAQAWLESADIQRTKEKGFQMAMQLPLEEGEKLIMSLKLPTDDKKEVLSDYKFEKDTETASLKAAKDKATEELKQSIDNIFILPQNEFLANVSETLNNINTSELFTVKDKEEQRKKINDRVEAIKDGKVDPVTQFDAETYNKWSIKITRNPELVKESDIRGLVGMPDGVTVAQAETLLSLKRKFTEGKSLNNDIHDMYSTVLTSLKTSNAYSKDKVKNAKLAGKSQILLDKFTEQNPEATEEEYEKFFNKLIENNYELWKGDNLLHPLRFIRGLITVGTKKETRRSIPQNIEKLEKELGTKNTDKDLSEMSDEELMKRIMGK